MPKGEESASLLIVAVHQTKNRRGGSQEQLIEFALVPLASIAVVPPCAPRLAFIGS